MTIVTTRYGYKRPPRKRKAVARDVPTIVTPAPTRGGAADALWRELVRRVRS